jgi:excinuclease ABC subunit C
MLWLSGKKGKQVSIAVPQRGERRRLVDLANENAREALQMMRVKWLADRGKTSAALEQLRDELGLDDLPRRIECYDISNTQGTNSVASMVVFIDGHPRPQEYRRFKIKTVEGANDFASHAEVMRRRFKRAKDADGNPDASEKDKSWAQWPDLVIIDGGKGQLSAALDAMRDVGVAHIPTVGLAKENEEIFVKDVSEPIILPRTSEGLYLVQRIRDEAHRFAITFHRQVRGKQGVKSVLDEIGGIGPARKKALIRRFGSVRGVREASVEEIAATQGFTTTLAEKVKAAL